MADVLKKVPVREQDPKVRATNFEEVCYGYNQEEAMEEASRCINCKNAKCIQGCPVGINIPAFVHEVKEGNIEEAYKIIGQSSALPAVCGRVCPQESQCEGKCIRGIKGESISIGKLERFVADYALEHDSISFLETRMPVKVIRTMQRAITKKQRLIIREHRQHIRHRAHWMQWDQMELRRILPVEQAPRDNKI